MNRLVGFVGEHYGGTFGRKSLHDLTIAELEQYAIAAASVKTKKRR